MGSWSGRRVAVAGVARELMMFVGGAVGGRVQGVRLRATVSARVVAGWMGREVVRVAAWVGAMGVAKVKEKVMAVAVAVSLGKER